MRRLRQFGTGAAVVAALALASAAPAAAGEFHGDRHGYGGYHRYDHGDGFGNFLLGAALVGGVVAIASAASAQRAPAYDGGYPGGAYPDGRYPDGRYPDGAYPDGAYPDGRYPNQAPGQDPRADGWRGFADAAADRCARAATRVAEADSGGVAHVTGIDRVEPFRGGARVFGTLEVEVRDDGAAPRRDHTRFDCTADAGRVTGLRVG